MESTQIITIIDALDSLPAHDSDAPAHLNSLPWMIIRSILSSKKASRKNGQMKMARLMAVFTSQVLVLIKLDMQESKLC